MKLTDDQAEIIDDAIEQALNDHDTWANGSQCSCGVKDNMDGDVLFSHRLGVISAAVHNAILSL